MGWEQRVDWGTEIDSGMREREKEQEMRRERDCGASPAAVPWKVPEGAYTSPASLFLTRQPVLATFSRSVASASCQRKQRARFVKPKVKLRSNEGTVLLWGTSGIILPQTPAARLRRTLNVKRRLLSHCRRGMCKVAMVLLSYFQVCHWTAPSMHGLQWDECHMSDKRRHALILKYACIIWFKMRWQIRLPLPKIWSLQWSESPPMKQVFRGCWVLLWRISGDRCHQQVFYEAMRGPAVNKTIWRLTIRNLRGVKPGGEDMREVRRTNQPLQRRKKTENRKASDYFSLLKWLLTTKSFINWCLWLSV